jgi:hypothetical protein
MRLSGLGSAVSGYYSAELRYQTRCGIQLVSVTVLHPGGARFESPSRHNHPYCGFMSFPRSLQTNAETAPRLDYDRFLPNPLQSITHRYYATYDLEQTLSLM